MLVIFLFCYFQKHQKTELINIDDVGLSNNLVMAQQVHPLKVFKPNGEYGLWVWGGGWIVARVTDCCTDSGLLLDGWVVARMTDCCTDSGLLLVDRCEDNNDDDHDDHGDIVPNEQ